MISNRELQRQVRQKCIKAVTLSKNSRNLLNEYCRTVEDEEDNLLLDSRFQVRSLLGEAVGNVKL
jgi:hypothetical protein